MIKKVVIIVLTVITSFSANAQFDIISKISSENRILKAAIDSGLVVVQQKYVLKDVETGDLYGQGGRNYFGRKFYLAARAGNKLLLPKEARHPWKKHEAYTPYQEDTTVTPVLSKNMARNVKDTVYHTFTYKDSSLSKWDSLYFKKGMYRTVADVPAKSLPYKEVCKANKGWMVVVHGAKNIAEHPGTKLKYYIYKVQPDFSANDTVAFVEKPKVENILGGIWVKPEVKTGLATIHVCGMLFNKGDKWFVRNFPKKPENKENQEQDTSLSRIPQPEDYATITFMHKSGFPLRMMEGISVEGFDKTFKTDEDGKLKLLLGPEDDKHLLRINGVGTRCIQRNHDYTIKCKYKRYFGEDKFLPTDEKDTCN